MEISVDRPQPKVRIPIAHARALIVAAVFVLAPIAPTALGAKQDGDAVSSAGVVRGRALFEGKGSCLSCHRVKGNGSRLGPELTDVGLQRSADELRRSLLEPDAEVLPRNRSYRVVTSDGSTITGRLLNHDTFSVQLMGPKEELLAFRKSGLREFGFVKKSAMPSSKDRLTDEELRDLVGYLVSLKGIGQ